MNTTVGALNRMLVDGDDLVPAFIGNVDDIGSELHRHIVDQDAIGSSVASAFVATA